MVGEYPHPEKEGVPRGSTSKVAVQGVPDDEDMQGEPDVRREYLR